MTTELKVLLAFVIPLGVLSKLIFWFLAITFTQTVIASL